MSSFFCFVVEVEFWNLEYVISLPRNRTHSFAVVAEKKRRREVAVRKKEKEKTRYQLLLWKNCAFSKSHYFSCDLHCAACHTSWLLLRRS